MLLEHSSLLLPIEVMMSRLSKIRVLVLLPPTPPTTAEVVDPDAEPDGPGAAACWSVTAFDSDTRLLAAR